MTFQEPEVVLIFKLTFSVFRTNEEGEAIEAFAEQPTSLLRLPGLF